MFRQLQNIRGMQVVAMAEGRIMGTVQKMYLNPAKKRVTGMVVREAGFGGQENWVEVSDIEQVGENVIFVTRAGVCKAKRPVGRSLKDLMGMQVATKAGKILGSLVDVEIDENWNVVEITLSDKRVVKIDPRQTVFGEDAILLRAGAETLLRSAASQKSGFLARVFGTEAVAETAGAIARAEKMARPAPVKSEKKTKQGKSKKKTKK